MLQMCLSVGWWLGVGDQFSVVFAAPVATSHLRLSYISWVQKYVLLSLLVIGMALRNPV